MPLVLSALMSKILVLTWLPNLLARPRSGFGGVQPQPQPQPVQQSMRAAPALHRQPQPAAASPARQVAPAPSMRSSKSSMAMFGKHAFSPGPSSPLARLALCELPLLTPQANPGPRYRCGRST